jgi:hypothetical protein
MKGLKMMSLNSAKVFCMMAIALIMCCCRSTGTLLTPENDWLFLAQGTATHLRETDNFKIRSKEKFAALRFYVYNRGVSIKRVEVVLINGDVLRPLIDSHIDAGNRSRLIELSSEGKQIEKIVVRYKSDGKLFSDKALVQIAGLRPR